MWFIIMWFLNCIRMIYQQLMKCSGTQNPSFIEIHYHKNSARTNCCRGCLCICLSSISQNDRPHAGTSQHKKSSKGRGVVPRFLCPQLSHLQRAPVRGVASAWQVSPGSWQYCAEDSLRTYLLLIEIQHLNAEEIKREYWAWKRWRSVCCLQRTPNCQAVGKAWFGPEKDSRAWDVEAEGRVSTGPWLQGVLAPCSTSLTPPIQGTDPPYAPKLMPTPWKTAPPSALGMLLCKLARKEGRGICEHGWSLWTPGLLEELLHNSIYMMLEHSSFKSQPRRIAPDSPCQNPWDGAKGMTLTAAGGLSTPWEVPEVSGSSLITAHYGF